VAKSLVEAMTMLQEFGGLDTQGYSIDNNMDTQHLVKHKWRNEIIVPYLAVQNNVTFMCDNGEKHIITADQKKALVLEKKEYHMCELEDTVKRLYGMEVWPFVLRWYNNGFKYLSPSFIYIKSQIVE
jgi:hypothetical protein